MKKQVITQKQYEEMVWHIFDSICPKWQGIKMVFFNGYTGKLDIEIKITSILDVIKKSVDKNFNVKG